MTPFYKIHYKFPGPTGKSGVYPAEYTKELALFWLRWLGRKDTLGLTYWAEPVGGGERLTVETVRVVEAGAK